jgi:hypothetical protein
MPDPTNDPSRIPELERLPSAAEAPPELERRVVQALRREGLLAESAAAAVPASRPRGLRSLRWAFAAIALAAVFASGWWFGGNRTRGVAEPQPTFVLLLREGAEFRTPSEGQIDQRVREYAQWAARVRREGVAISGEKLNDRVRLLTVQGIAAPSQAAPSTAVPPESTDDAGPVTGFFLIRARDFEHAQKIAESCPHVRYGGAVEIRPIDGL